LSIARAKDFDHAIALANDSRFALTGGIYSRSPVNIERAKAELVCGNLYINRAITGAIVGRHPFGGFKMSGGGTKAGGVEYLQNFSSRAPSARIASGAVLPRRRRGRPARSVSNQYSVIAAFSATIAKAGV